jgi:hypothetical protein
MKEYVENINTEFNSMKNENLDFKDYTQNVRIGLDLVKDQVVKWNTHLEKIWLKA